MRRAEQRREVAEAHRATSAGQGADLICKWILKEEIDGGCGEQIAAPVRKDFADRERNGSLPELPGHRTIFLDERIERSKPKRLVDEKVTANQSTAKWHCRWTLYAFKNPDVRDGSVELALGPQWKRYQVTSDKEARAEQAGPQRSSLFNAG
jgi:hypothetical protein